MGQNKSKINIEKFIVSAGVYCIGILIALLIAWSVLSIVKSIAEENQIKQAAVTDPIREQYPRMKSEWYQHIKSECGSDVPVAAFCALIDTESEWLPSATSPSGAMGLTQLMPETARILSISEPYNWKQNISGGVHHFRHCLRRANGDLRLAFKKYHGGPGRTTFGPRSDDYASKCERKMRGSDQMVAAL